MTPTEEASSYEVGYAYPTSETANRLNRSAGCHFYRASAVLLAFDAAADAEAYARSTGLAPSRFSIDHPMNAKYRLNYGPKETTT